MQLPNHSELQKFNYKVQMLYIAYVNYFRKEDCILITSSMWVISAACDYFAKLVLDGSKRYVDTGLFQIYFNLQVYYTFAYIITSILFLLIK